MTRTNFMYGSVILFYVGTFVFFTMSVVSAGSLTCSIVASSSCTTGVVVLRMASSTNAHAEMATGTTAGYASNVVCCTGVSGMSNTCNGTSAIILKLASTTNAHVQVNTQSGYANNACMSVPAGGTVSIGYQATNCTGFDTTLASVASTSNSQVGSPSSYITKVCGSMASSQSIVFSISTSTISFGNLTFGASSYASSTAQGSPAEVEAHTISASTNAPSGYVVTVQGQTLTSQQYNQNTISAIGGTNSTPAPGTEQFGMRVATSSGNGFITSPYALSGFAYAGTATTTSQVSTGGGDGITTIFSIRYVANIASITEAGTYATSLVYVATANF